MSQTPSDPSLDSRANPPDAPPGLTDQQLAKQARAAADQALQLARLAEESARLARHLNEQVAFRAGQTSGNTTDVVEPSGTSATADRITADKPAGDQSSRRPPLPLVTDAEERWQALTGRACRTRRSARARHSTGRGHMGDHDSSRNWKSILLSTLLHVMLLAALGLLTIAIRPETQVDTILASIGNAETPPPEAAIEEVGEQPEQPVSDVPPVPQEPPPQVELPEVLPEEKPPVAPVPKPAPMAAKAPPAVAEGQAADKPGFDLTTAGSRSDAGKAFLLKKYGGTAASESAVSRALDWFVAIQRRDGSWNFNDVGGASHAGSVNNPMGATSYVILAFLGAGQTHQSGRHKASVSRAISFLIKYGRHVPAGADFRGPNVEAHHNFYVQGAAAMALCEAFTMTKDRRLRVPAQRAIDFIVAAQDPHGGGWRYEPLEAGCTSVSTLQLTALISAQRVGLNVPPGTLERVRHFYETVHCDNAPTGRYCYRASEPSYKSASTAQATLGRMYLGAARNDEDLQAAIRLLDERGPYDNRYYCYYATQAIKNWGGEEWERWNPSMRDELIRTQVVEDGPAMGSWTPLQRGPTDTSGGRLFITALSTMTLEVYYRYLPIYDALDEKNTAPEKSPNLANGTDALQSRTP